MVRVTRTIQTLPAWSLIVLMWACGSTDSGPPATAVQSVEGRSTTQSVATPVGTCGAKGQPDCPLQGWMKANLQSQVRAKDFARLESALAELAAKNIEPFGNWGALAQRGADAAAKQDMSGIRKACKACHDEHRDNFRRNMRTSTDVVP